MVFGSGSAILSYEGSIALNLNDSLTEHISFAFPRESELLDAFNTFMLKMKQTGVLRRIQGKWIPSGTAKPEGDAAIVLGFENLSFPFLVLGSGALIGAALELPMLARYARRFFASN